MKNRHKISILSIVLFAFVGSGAMSQNNAIIFKAMQDELNRNMAKLTMETLQNPFFISYTLEKSNQISVQSTLGTIIESSESASAKPSVRLMVGNYHLNDENFSDEGAYSFFFGGGGSSGNASLEDDYLAIRRAFWLQTDEIYKSAAESYEKKISAIENQNLSDELKNLDDFTKTDPVEKIVEGVAVGLDKAQCERMAKELSALFKGNAGINSSDVSIQVYQSDIFMVNSEGTKTKTPVNIVNVTVTASVQAADGVEFGDELTFYAALGKELPTLEEMKVEVANFKDHLISLKTAPVLDKAYNGPILFEEEAVADLFINKFFKNSALVAHRDMIYSNPQMSMMNQSKKSPLADKLDEEVIAPQFSLISNSTIDKFNSKSLLGHYPVDAEGIVPEETVLIENGVLKTFLSNRTPSLKMAKSNGHQRYSFQFGSLSTATGPGVILVKNSKAVSADKIQKNLSKIAKKAGFDYYLLVKEIKEKKSAGGFSFMMSGGGSQKEYSAFRVYKVMVKDGKTELIRPVDLKNMEDALEKIAGASEPDFVYNTLLNSGGLGGLIMFGSAGKMLSGIPASFIVPGAIAFEKLKAEKEQILTTEKLPVVSNPVQ